MKLYYSPGACSMAAHIVLNETGTPYTLDKVDLASKKTETGADYLAINGNGYVPALEYKKGETLTEVSTILQFLADRAESAGLIPKFGTMDRYRAMEALNFVASELHKSMGSLFAKSMPDDARKVIVDRLSARLAWLDSKLGKQDYLLGSAFSVADAYAFTVLNWGQWVGVDLKPWKNISAYISRIAARPAVQTTLKAEGLAA